MNDTEPIDSDATCYGGAGLSNVFTFFDHVLDMRCGPPPDGAEEPGCERIRVCVSALRDGETACDPLRRRSIPSRRRGATSPRVRGSRWGASNTFRPAHSEARPRP